MTEVDLIYDAPDYWTRLEHQYAEISCEVAHALVEKLKEQEE